MVTTDSGIEYEQNPANFSCSVVILEAESNSLQHIQPLVPELLDVLRSLPPCVVGRIENEK